MKTIFVTGAASGIGKATALLFGRRGWFVGCYDLDVDGARRVAEEIGSRASHGRIEVTNVESWKTAISDFQAASSSNGKLDVLFNCAGILRMGRFDEISTEQCRLQLDVNVMGVVNGIQICLPLLERAKGSIVNMSSASAIYGQPELAVYSASKFAVRALTEALDIELRPRGVRVADVMPGYVDTPMVSSQTHRATTLDKMGVKLTADRVAEVVWKAAHGRGLHYMPQRDMRMMSRVSGLLPGVTRTVMRRMATR
jgi:NAD(P)-dependent dehydrogenase (short-subunit alcohol dehydrogenase family)